MCKNQFEEALTDMAKAIELNPAEPANYKNRSIIYARMGKQEEADLDRKKLKELEERNRSPG